MMSLQKDTFGKDGWIIYYLHLILRTEGSRMFQCYKFCWRKIDRQSGGLGRRGARVAEDMGLETRTSFHNWCPRRDLSPNARRHPLSIMN